MSTNDITRFDQKTCFLFRQRQTNTDENFSEQISKMMKEVISLKVHSSVQTNVRMKMSRTKKIFSRSVVSSCRLFFKRSDSGLDDKIKHRYMMCMTRWERYNTKESAVLVFFLLSAHFDTGKNYIVEIQVENVFFHQVNILTIVQC